MKILGIFFISLLYSSIISAQNLSPSISELRSMEDTNGNTHLFYRLNSSWGDSYNNGFDKSIYHFNLTDNSDSLFLSSNGIHNSLFFYSIYIEDFEFWHKDPAKYIYIGLNCGDDCTGFVRRFDSAQVYNQIFFSQTGNRLAISDFNDSIVFSSISGRIIKSTDGGINWYINDSTDYLQLLSISPFTENVVFAYDYNGYIEKSIDGGKTFRIVDISSISTNSSLNNIYYDKDSLHVYRILYNYDGGKSYMYFMQSSNYGELNSWSKKYSSANSLYLSVDYSKSGTIYLVDNKNIFISTDYGSTFVLYKSLDSTIVGIYKKSGSDKLYAATKYDIFEITTSSIKSIKHIITSVNDRKKEVPVSFVLYQNYPNPFNPATTITYEIPKTGLVQLKIYDVLGREISSLVNEEQASGKHSVVFSSQQQNKQLSSGIYFYRLKAGSYIVSKKMVLLR